VTRPDFNVLIGGFVTTRTESSQTAGPVWKTDSRAASEVTSGVSRRKPKGWMPPTGYSFRKREVNRAIGKSHLQVDGVYPAGHWSTYEGLVGNSGCFNSLNHFNEIYSETSALTVPARLANSALIAARNRLKDQKVDLGTAWGERKQTMRLLGDTATSMATALKRLRHGDIRGAMRDLGISSKKRAPKGSNVTNKWLELQYGWKPLLSDIYGSCDALSKRDKSDWRVTAKALRSEFSVYPYERLFTGGSNFDSYRGTAKVERGAFVRIDAIPHNDLTMSLASLGVLNPLNVGWELVPFSFVVDWFLPIGGWLSSLDALVGYTDAYTSTSKLVRAEWEDVGVSVDISKTRYVHNSWRGTKRVVDLVRTAQSGVPLATLPSIKDPRSLAHMANGLALLSQVFGR